MDSLDELWNTYAEWKRLTEKEGAAITRSQWRDVQEAQDQKRALQPEIIRLSDRVQTVLRSEAEKQLFSTRLRGIVHELVLLESQNNLKVQDSISAAEQQRRTLDVTSNRLRRMHHRYVPSLDPIWQNLS